MGKKGTPFTQGSAKVEGSRSSRRMGREDKGHLGTSFVSSDPNKLTRFCLAPDFSTLEGGAKDRHWRTVTSAGPPWQPDLRCAGLSYTSAGSDNPG